MSYPSFVKSLLFVSLGIGLVLPMISPSLAESLKPASQARIQNPSHSIQSPPLPPLGEPNKFIPPDPTAIVNPIEQVHLVIKLKERRVYVYRQNQVLTSYPIAVGKSGWETPQGKFKVQAMIKNPSWEHPWTGEVVPSGKDNPLGSRWIGFWSDGKNVIGFHGTPNERSIGRAASHGCVRMFDKDVQALFEKVTVGTPVIVEP